MKDGACRHFGALALVRLSPNNTLNTLRPPAWHSLAQDGAFPSKNTTYPKTDKKAKKHVVVFSRDTQKKKSTLLSPEHTKNTYLQ